MPFLSRPGRRSRLALVALAVMAASLSTVTLATAASAAPPATQSQVGGGATTNALSCVSYRTVNRSFKDLYSADQRIFTVQWTNLHVCYNGTNVYLTQDPQFRVYIAGPFSGSLQGACAGVSRSATDPTNTAKQSSIFITCNAVFSNKGLGTYWPKSEIDVNNNSDFIIPAFLNAGINLGTFGFLGGGIGGADQARFYTLRIYANGQYEVSGVGNTATNPL
jgi:hypothetical protein